MDSPDGNVALEEAYKVDVAYCSRVGKYKPNVNRPITVTFQQKQDKERLMKSKSRLPRGVYINNELPTEIKKRQDQLHPIYHMVKLLPDYRDGCKLSGDVFIINGVRYTLLHDIHKLPPEIAAYKLTEKKNKNYLAFHGEWSSYSNFHQSQFELGGNKFNTAEQYIQYHKALFFGDIDTASRILQTESPYEMKQLSYQIKDVDYHRWQNEGFEICFEGIKAKFMQNESLLKMLKQLLH